MHKPPPDPAAALTESFGPFGLGLMAVCRVAAIVGGLVFMGLVAMSIVSITGRKLWSAPVPGDFEVLQMCSAFAASTFFAYCHLNHGDVKVDFFTAHWRVSRVHWLDAIGCGLLGLFGLLIAWRTAVGALSLREVGETSVILGWPLWVAQALMVPGFLLMGAAGLYMVGQHVARARSQARP